MQAKIYKVFFMGFVILLGQFFIPASASAIAGDEESTKTKVITALQNGQSTFAKKMLFDLVYEYPASDHHQKYIAELVSLYYHNREYKDASELSHEYLQDYPSGDYVSYMTFMYGLNTYLSTTTHIMHDLYSPSYGITDVYAVKKAKQTFESLIAHDPSSPYAEPARAMIEKINLKLATQELLIAQHYFEKKAYQGAINRANLVLEMSENVQLRNKATSILHASKKALSS